MFLSGLENNMVYELKSRLHHSDWCYIEIRFLVIITLVNKEILLLTSLMKSSNVHLSSSNVINNAQLIIKSINNYFFRTHTIRQNAWTERRYKSGQKDNKNCLKSKNWLRPNSIFDTVTKKYNFFQSTCQRTPRYPFTVESINRASPKDSLLSHTTTQQTRIKGERKNKLGLPAAEEVAQAHGTTTRFRKSTGDQVDTNLIPTEW